MAAATPQAIALAYNELYKINQPGALNVIVVETDGRPNTVTMNFWDGSVAGLSSSSPCQDNNSKQISQNGFRTSGVLPAWTGGHSMNAGGTGYMADIPAGTGLGSSGSFTTGRRARRERCQHRIPFVQLLDVAEDQHVQRSCQRLTNPPVLYG